jgi:nucleoid-associated protein YgaU
VAGAVVAGVLLWLWLSPGGNSGKQEQETVIAAADTVPDDSIEVAEEAAKPVVTDIVTSQIVLVTLAEKHYGSPWFWVYIYEENRSIISNPNNVKPGTEVVIPPAEKYGIDAKDPASVKKAQRLSWELLKGK